MPTQTVSTHRPFNVSQFVFTVIAVLLLVGLNSSAKAQGYIGPDGGNWSDPNNWDPTGVPTGGEQAYLGEDPSLNVNFDYAYDSNNELGALLIDYNTSLTQSSASSSMDVSGEELIGKYYSGEYDQSAGTNDASSVALGSTRPFGTNNLNIYRLSGTEVLNGTSFGSLGVGGYAPAEFFQTGGSNYSSDVAIGSGSSYSMQGGTLAPTTGQQYFGMTPTGTGRIDVTGDFSQTGGATSAQTINIYAQSYLPNPTVELSGDASSTINTVQEFINNGTFTQSGGVNTVSYSYLYVFPADLVVGASSGSGAAQYKLGGGALNADREDIGENSVADGDTADFNQTSGTNTVTTLNVALTAGGTGTYEMSGGTLAVLGGLSVGGSPAKPGGTGSFTLTNGAAATVGYKVTTGLNGTVDASHGSLTVGYNSSAAPLATLGQILVDQGGILGGNNYVGNVMNNGLVYPGDPTKMTITGNYTQGATGNLQLDIAGSNVGQYDQLDVQGELTLLAGSTLTLNFINGYAPTTIATYDLIDFESVDPTNNFFSNVVVNGLSGYTYTFVPSFGEGGVNYRFVAVQDIPEPSTVVLVLIGAGFLALPIRRLRKVSQR